MPLNGHGTEEKRGVAKLTAVHIPILVHLHLQQDVKASIDRDVKLGVLEVVPVEERVTLCH